MMYDTLIQACNIITDTVKEFVLLEKKLDSNKEPYYQEWVARGYLAVKEIDGQKVKYFIQEQFMSYLPIKVTETAEFFIQESKAKSIVQVVQNPTPFKIVPQQCFDDNHAFIDEITPFAHSNPDGQTLMKLCAFQSFIGKTFMGLCSESEFGKTGIFRIVDGLTEKSIVYQPRSVPGVLIQINGDGNMAFD
jgi:hypothetical protein